MKAKTILLLLLIPTISLEAQQGGEQKMVRQEIAQEMREFLQNYVVDPWYPKILDTVHGGFLSDFDALWQPFGDQKKMIVTQSRHVWSPSRLSLFHDSDKYVYVADHGAAFLEYKMWDPDFGGFFQLVTREGRPVDPDPKLGFIKTAYGNAFAIYGLSAHYEATGDHASLRLAKLGFEWLEKHSHDPEYGGYFQFLQQDGTPMKGGHTAPPKDQNSSIHLLEAFSELYKVWPDSLVKARVEELLVIIRDTITTDKGYMNLFFQQDWTPVIFRDSSEEVRERNHHLDHVSFGHDIETAYLLREAAEVIYHEVDETTAIKSKKMVDHTIKHAWDEEPGGFLDRGYYYEEEGDLEIIEDAKVWWAQVEAMNTLLIMTDLYPDDDIAYFDFFIKQWNYIKHYLFDQEHMGIYSAGLDTRPSSKEGRKASIWKGNYHTLRSLVNCIERLEK